MTSLQPGSPGIQACINAGNAISDIIGDLDNTIILATAESDNEAFLDHKENILKAAKAFIEDTKSFVAGAASSQEQLTVAAQNVVTTFIQLTEVVKRAAASLGSNNPETQVLLINAVKNVATALGDLVPVTKAAHGKSIDGPEISNLKGSAQTMIANVSLLLENVRSVAEEHSGGTHAAESTTEARGQEQMETGDVVVCRSDLMGSFFARELAAKAKYEKKKSLEETGYAEVFRPDRELELAREKLAALRNAKYGKKSLEEHHSNDSQ